MLQPRCWNTFLTILALVNRLSQLRITKFRLLNQSSGNTIGNWRKLRIKVTTTVLLVNLCTMAGFRNDSSRKNTLRNSNEFQVCFFILIDHLLSALQSHLFSYFFLLFGLVLLSYHLLKLFLDHKIVHEQ